MISHTSFFFSFLFFSFGRHPVAAAAVICAFSTHPVVEKWFVRQEANSESVRVCVYKSLCLLCDE